MKKYIDIGRRLRSWGENKYGKMSVFAETLSVTPQHLDAYLSGRQKPGNKMQSQLRELGCNIAWLIYGETEEEIQKKWENSRIGRAMKYQDKDFDMLDYLKKIGIDNLEALEKFCDPQNIAQDVAMVLRERIAKYKFKNKK